MTNDRDRLSSDMNSLAKPLQRKVLRATLLIICGAASVSAPGQQLLTANDVHAKSKHGLSEVRRSYSAFDLAGTTSISCEGAVDWDTLFKGQTSSSFRERVLPVLRGTRFLVTMDKDGAVKVATLSTVAAADQQAQARANSSIQGFGGVIATVLQGWARFAVAADLPPSSEDYKLDKAGDHYLLAFRNGPRDVAITMDRSFVMSEERIDTTDGSTLTHPAFAASRGGYLVTSWNVAFPRGKGSDLSVDARYMQVEGVEVPSEMTLYSRLPNFGELTLSLVLTNYQFKR